MKILQDTFLTNCDACDEDLAFLLRTSRPAYEDMSAPIRIVDLFCGCGGLSLGIAEAAARAGRGSQIALAVDHDQDAVAVFRANFPTATVRHDAVDVLLNGQLGARRTNAERAIADETEDVDILVGGPPCQGYSDLNNHTRRADPRNALYARMARAAWLLQPSVVLIENVPAIQHDRGGLETTLSWLRKAGYLVEHGVVDLLRLGAPQRRRRHIVLAVRDDQGWAPKPVLESLQPPCAAHVREVRWAIGDLEHVQPQRVIDIPSVPTPTNAERIRWLFDNDAYDLPNDKRPQCHHSEHSYVSMYGRLRWDEPAQTVTTGFGSMGQGRYVHPSRQRTLTPHEAARLQMLPDFFDFSSARSRGAIARMIGNMVPPVLGIAVGARVLEELAGRGPLRRSSDPSS